MSARWSATGTTRYRLTFGPASSARAYAMSSAGAGGASRSFSRPWTAWKYVSRWCSQPWSSAPSASAAWSVAGGSGSTALISRLRCRPGIVGQASERVGVVAPAQTCGSCAAPRLPVPRERAPRAWSNIAPLAAYRPHCLPRPGWGGLGASWHAHLAPVLASEGGRRSYARRARACATIRFRDRTTTLIVPRRARAARSKGRAQPVITQRHPSRPTPTVRPSIFERQLTRTRPVRAIVPDTRSLRPASRARDPRPHGFGPAPAPAAPRRCRAPRCADHPAPGCRAATAARCRAPVPAPSPVRRRSSRR